MTVNNLFLYLLYFTLVLSGLLVFKSLFRNRLSARVQLWLWVLIFAYLLIPVMPESDASVYNLLPNEAPGFSVAMPLEGSVNTQTPSPMPEEPMATDHHDMIQNLLNQIAPDLLMGGIWLMGVLFLLGYYATAYLRCINKVRHMPTITDDTIVREFETVRTRLGIKRKISLVSGGDTPMLVGFIRPRVLLPEGYSPKDREAVFTHELSHWKHGDLILLWAALLFLIVHWYHPLAWVGHRVFRRDIEAYCDRRVVNLLGNKKEYASLLLSTALRKNRFVAGTTALQNGEKEVSRRIRYLANFKKPTVWGGICILVLGVAVGTILLTNANRSYNMDSDRLGEYAITPAPNYMADIAYADGDIAVFYWQDGLFVYDINEDRITKAIDLSRLQVIPQEWEGARLSVTVSADGKTALLVNENAEQMPELSNYRINLRTGRAYKTKATILKNPFEGRADLGIESARYDPNARYSLSMIDTKEGYWYLTFSGTRLGNVKLCRLQGGILSTVYPFGDFGTEATPKLPYKSEEYQQIMEELAQAGAHIFLNASYGWTFSVDSGYEFGEIEYLADYLTGGEVDLHSTLVGMGIVPSDYYGKAIYVRVDVVTADDGSGIPHFCLMLPEKGDVLAHQLLTKEQEEQLQRICYYAEKLHPKAGALEPISALYTLTKSELVDHFRITNEMGYVFRSAEIDDWVEAAGGDKIRKAKFTLKLLYEKEEDNADAPLNIEYKMQVQCDGQSVQLFYGQGEELHPLALSDFYPVRTILAQSPAPL